MFSALLRDLSVRVPALGEMLRVPEKEQREAGYFDTLREILQQPDTWTGTAATAVAAREELRAALEGVRTLVLTGSGSSEYAGDCLALALQAALNIPAEAVGGGQILTHGGAAFAPGRPCLIVSLARSGNSPESCGAVDLMLETEPECRHLAITCNRQGRLATSYRDNPRFRSLVLDDRTNDRSLVMTSSFTNMVVAGRLLGMLDRPADYEAAMGAVSRAGAQVLAQSTQALAEAARRDFRSAIYLGSGVRFGAARETGLKVLEMTGGQIHTMPETYLGLRHGPMSSSHADTAMVCFLSSDKLVRAYELDLIRELNRKQLGAFKIVAGQSIPAELLRPGDVAVEYPAGISDEDAPVLDVLVGQLFAFFKCRAAGFKPDAPSASGVITRVVEPFRIHRRSESEVS